MKNQLRCMTIDTDRSDTNNNFMACGNDFSCVDPNFPTGKHSDSFE
jgi:hypothetical protein